jgi:hypothetical protein
MASVYNPWKLASLQVDMTFDDSREKATVTVTGPDFNDVWQWGGPKERFAPSSLRGAVKGEAIELTDADAALVEPLVSGDPREGLLKQKRTQDVGHSTAGIGRQ